MIKIFPYYDVPAYFFSTTHRVVLLQLELRLLFRSKLLEEYIVSGLWASFIADDFKTVQIVIYGHGRRNKVRGVAHFGLFEECADRGARLCFWLLV